jgi:hypothetical protein
MADVFQAFLPWEGEFIKKAADEPNMVPFQITMLNNENLAEMLRHTGAISPGTSVSKFTAKPIGDNADGRLGVLSCIFRLTAEYTGGKGPASMIYKSCPLTPDFYMLRGLCKGQRSFDLEVRSYACNNDWLPPSWASPKGYFAVLDEEASRFVILMEDMNEVSPNMTPGDQVAGLDIDQSDAMVVAFATELPKMHAMYWNRCTEMNCQEWARDLTSPFFIHVFPMIFQGVWPVFMKTIEDCSLPKPSAELKSFGEELLDTAFMVDLVSICAVENGIEAGGFLHYTVAHGDYRLDNIFFDWAPDGKTITRDAGGNPVWSVIDFQLVSTNTNPCWDLAYCVSQSVSPAFRRLHERQLIEAYYQALIENGVDEKQFTFAQCLYHYQLATGNAFLYYVFASNGAAPNGPRGKTLATNICNRYAEMFADWETRKVTMWTLEMAKSRKKKGTRGPLSDEECLSIIPAAMQAWVRERGCTGVQTTGTYLRAEIDPILAPLIRALIQERPHGVDAIKKAMAKLLEGGN